MRDAPSWDVWLTLRSPFLAVLEEQRLQRSCVRAGTQQGIHRVFLRGRQQTACDWGTLQGTAHCSTCQDLHRAAPGSARYLLVVLIPSVLHIPCSPINHSREQGVLHPRPASSRPIFQAASRSYGGHSAMQKPNLCNKTACSTPHMQGLLLPFLQEGGLEPTALSKVSVPSGQQLCRTAAPPAAAPYLGGNQKVGSNSLQGCGQLWPTAAGRCDNTTEDLGWLFSRCTKTSASTACTGDITDQQSTEQMLKCSFTFVFSLNFKMASSVSFIWSLIWKNHWVTKTPWPFIYYQFSF